MGMNITGTVKTADVYEVNGKDNTKKPMISFTVVDGLGTSSPARCGLMIPSSLRSRK